MAMFGACENVKPAYAESFGQASAQFHQLSTITHQLFCLDSERELRGFRAQIPAPDVRRPRRAGACLAHAQERGHAEPAGTRLSLCGPPRDWEDFDRANLGQSAQLRERADR